MFTRNHHNHTATKLPNEWAESMLNLLNQLYSKEISDNNKTFELYGEVYESELILVVTLLDKTNPHHRTPCSFFISCDIDEKTKINKLLDDLVDGIGVLLDDYFNNVSNWEGYLDIWTKADFKKREFYYKITRENVALTLMANKLLGE